jgi:hypothetical protein
MFAKRRKTGHWLLSLLLLAQLCAFVHAAEHGSGPHSHCDVVCLCAVGNDNDASVAHDLGGVEVWLITQDIATPPIACAPRMQTALRPYATGPPSRR